MTLRVAVVDYGLANIRSAVNALEYFGAKTTVARDGRSLSGVDKIVLPGVGSFDAGMRQLRKRRHADALEELVRVKGVPFLGICLGMQFLLNGSEEGCEHGLGWISGTVRHFPSGPDCPKVPHIGWSEVDVTKADGLFRDLSPPVDVYFVHSYYVPNEGEAKTYGSAICTYGVLFVAAFEFDNVFATQFHPEKSQMAGMKIIETFLLR